MIPFTNPPLGEDLSSDDLEAFSSLPSVYSSASQSVGFVINLGHVLADSGFKEIRDEVYPFIKESLHGICHPRVLMGLAIVMWFTTKVSINFQYS